LTTITDIARLAEVSVATVSHVVNKTRYVSPELVRKVEDTIDSLDEIPNFIEKKKELIENVPNFIVFYMPQSESAQNKMIFEKIMKKFIYEENLVLLPVSYSDINKRIKEISTSVAQNISGQIILLSEDNQTDVNITYTKLPTLFISNNDYSHSGGTSIIFDQYYHSYLATNYLINSGHQDILLLNETELIEDRTLKGYIKALEENSIPIRQEYINTNKNLKSEILSFFKNILLGDKSPTAIITNNKQLLQLLDFMEKHYIKSPEDISIVSLQNDQLLKYFSPSISAVDINTNKFFDVIIDFIESILNNSEKKGNIQNSKKISIDGELIIRSSTTGVGRGPNGAIATSIDSLKLTENEIQEITSQKRTAVISFHYTGADWMALHERAIRDVFEKLNIEVIAVTDAYFDTDLQNKQLDSLLTLDPDIFIAIPTDNVKTSDMFKKIANSDSNLILITNIPQGLSPSDYITIVSVNERSHGRLIASGLADNLRDLNKTNLAFFYHNIDFYATNQRDNSAKQMLLEEYPEVNIISENSFNEDTQLYDLTVDLIHNHSEVEGIYVSWDDPSKEVLRALKDYNREDIIVGTGDLNYDLALNMAKNGSIKSISAQQPYEQGKAIALASAKSLLNVPVAPYIGIEPIKVTKNNLLKSWSQIYKTEPPKKIKELFQ